MFEKSSNEKMHLQNFFFTLPNYGGRGGGEILVYSIGGTL